ncbi:resolvase [Streptomyces griseoloalbus]|uniref:resolvase n=1 Tax=Streptomyces griseoloalbus TaxID=67303 RepID=UPI00339DEED3
MCRPFTVHRRPRPRPRLGRGAIRTVVADLLPEHTASEEHSPAPELPVTLDMPGKVADFLRAAELDDVERAALDQGVTVRCGQGYTQRVGAVPAVHRQLLARCQPLNGGQGLLAVPAQRKARREYENRVSALTPGP